MQLGLGNKSGENLAKARKIEKENKVNFTKKKSRELLLSFCRVFPVFQLLNKYLQFHAILANFWVNIPTVEFFCQPSQIKLVLVSSQVNLPSTLLTR